MTGNLNASPHEPGSYYYPTGAAANPMMSTLPTYGFQHVAADTGPAEYSTDHGWHQAGHHTTISHPATEASPSNILSNAYGYLPYSEEQHHGLQAATFPTAFDGRYVAPASLEQQVPFVHDWNMHGVQAVEPNPASAFPQPGQGSTSMSPIEPGTGSGAHTPSSFTSTSSAGHYSSMYAGTTGIFDSQLAVTTGAETHFAPRSGAGEGVPTAARKGKARQKPKHGGSRSSGKAAGSGAKTAASTVISSSSGSGGESSLSGAGQQSSSHGSQSSGHAAPPPIAARSDDKRPRRSHNLVESQYRERLNDQFDKLRSALPPPADRLRGPGSGSGGSGDTRGVAGVAERQPSKAEVLEMARQHIQELEQRRDSLADEVKGLKGASLRLEQIYASQPLNQGQAVQPQSDLDDGGEYDEETQG